MKPVDILDIPNRIGDAEIILFPQDARSDHDRRYSVNPPPLAARQGNRLILGGDPDSGRFYQLLKGEQFVFTTQDRDARRRIFFGGMDESPFLAELELEVLEAMIQGEEAFFEALKPRIIRSWEQSIGIRAKRQGDFFAVPAAKKGRVSWEDFFIRSLKEKGRKAEVVYTEDTQLRGTRHTFVGMMAVVSNCIVGDGIIHAPDHEPLDLRGPHLIEQASYLAKPKEAD